jgi:hypothetical protein
LPSGGEEEGEEERGGCEEEEGCRGGRELEESRRFFEVPIPTPPPLPPELLWPPE